MSDETTRAVNDAVDWDNRKQLADLWQEHARLDSLDESTYDALLAVAEWGARSAIENAEFDGHPQLQVERDAARAELGEMQAWQNELAVTIMGEDEGDPDASQESIIMRRIQRMQAERDGLAASIDQARKRIRDGRYSRAVVEEVNALDAILAQSPADALAAHDAALLNTLQEADVALGDPEHPRWDTKSGEARRRLYGAVQIITRDEDERNRALDAHDAEVAAKALDEAADTFQYGAWLDVIDGPTTIKIANGGLVGAWLRDRAKTIRDGDTKGHGE